ncbi:GHKL domain-containing protein [Bacillaceae bacterium Marseille-Q3522]|nr:GHKL domain-containing protein [Bacillaceae bacterium Marseille-Q3522]
MNVLKKLPFPYFFVTENLELLNSSRKIGFSSLKEIADREHHSMLLNFIAADDSDCLPALPLHLDETTQYYKLFKIKDGDYLHLFCIPAEDKQMNAVTLETAELAHEIRNPLATIKGMLQLLTPLFKEAGKETYMKLAIKEIDRAAAIVAAILTQAKMQSQRVQQTHVNEVICEVVKLFEAQAILEKITINADLPSEIIFVKLDANLLKQVLINIINNAIDALKDSQQQKEIFILTKKEADFVKISVKDTGCGINSSAISQIFSPLFTTKEHGTGIGLSIAKKLLEKNNCRIYADSQKDKGTTFTIELPLLDIVPAI